VYLARKKISGEIRYFIRESCPGNPYPLTRDLFDLGKNPAEYIIYPGGNAYYFDDIIEDRLAELGVSFQEEELDDIFWPFLHHEIRRAHEYFRNRGHNHKEKTAEKISPSSRFHLFDRRRIHYLKYAQMDQGRIGNVSPKLFQILRGKSRDEIEQYFMDEERVLREREYKNYVYVIFDLQKHFPQHFAKTMPQGLDQNQVDDCFIREICRLCEDSRFWMGMESHGIPNEYLARYLYMFFDNDYGRSTYLEEMIQNWINSKRDFIPPQKRRTVSMREALTILGVTESELRGMNKRELTRLYRRKARDLHPDQGGDHEAFIRLTEVYHEIRERKK
jgi:hypothetical protein